MDEDTTWIVGRTQLEDFSFARSQMKMEKSINFFFHKEET